MHLMLVCANCVPTQSSGVLLAAALGLLIAILCLHACGMQWRRVSLCSGSLSPLKNEHCAASANAVVGNKQLQPTVIAYCCFTPPAGSKSLRAVWPRGH